MTDIQDTPILEENKAVNQVYNWKYILNIASEHKREIVYANIIAILATLASVPLPLLMPLLVDEVLLNQPAIVVATINANTPDAWHGPTLYITVILILTLCLRLTALVLNVWQSRQEFVCVFYHIWRKSPCLNMKRWAQVPSHHI